MCMLGGAFRWAVRAVGSSGNDKGNSIAVSKQGLVVAGAKGEKDANVNFNYEKDLVITSDATSNYIVMKLDCWNGDLIWYSVGERASSGSSYAYDVDM